MYIVMDMQIEVKIMVHASLVNADYYHDMVGMSGSVIILPGNGLGERPQEEIPGDLALLWAQII